MAYELYYLADTGNDFYGDAGGMSLFEEGGGLLEGLRIVREPLAVEPQAFPDRPTGCTSDEVWELICACMKKAPSERPNFAEVASKIGVARTKAGGSIASWL